MTPEEALEDLREHGDSLDTLNVLVSAERSEHPPGYEARRMKTNSELRQELWRIIQKTISSADDVVTKPYDPGYNPKPHEMLYIETAEEDELQQFRSHLTAIPEIPDFDEDNEEFAESLNFYALVGTPREGDSVIFCRKPYRKEDLAVNAGRRSRVRAIFGSSNRYEPFEQKVFRFDGKVDFFLWKGYFYILNPTHFNYVVGNFNEMKKKVGEYVENLKNKLPDELQIGNEQEFREACANDSRMAKKLAQVLDRPYWNGEDGNTVTVDKIEQVIEQFNLAEEERIQFDGSTLIFDPSSKQRWTLLKLLDDDYLGSEMTGRKYETNSKLDVSSK